MRRIRKKEGGFQMELSFHFSSRTPHYKSFQRHSWVFSKGEGNHLHTDKNPLTTLLSCLPFCLGWSVIPQEWNQQFSLLVNHSYNFPALTHPQVWNAGLSPASSQTSFYNCFSVIKTDQGVRLMSDMIIQSLAFDDLLNQPVMSSDLPLAGKSPCSSGIATSISL